MDRAQRLYDCITEIGDEYLYQAEQFRPVVRRVNWQRWGSLAAALVLVIGIGSWVMNGMYMGASKSESAAEAPAAPSAPAPSAPAASAPAASAPMVSEPSGEEFADIFDYTSGSWLAHTLVLEDQEYILLADGDPRLAEYGLPEHVSADLAGEQVAWLEITEEGLLEVCDYESGILLLSCTLDSEREIFIVLQDKLSLAAVACE